MTFDNRLLFYEPVPRLETMAAVRIALDMWSYRIHDGDLDLTDEYSRYDDLDEGIRQMADTLKMPGCTGDTIKKQIESVAAEISRWRRYHGRSISFDGAVRFVLKKYFANLSWRPDGTIDSKGTAASLVADGELDDVLKYRFACLYCMEEHIKKIWHRVRQRNAHEPDLPDFYANPMLFYWNTVMAGNPPEVPGDQATSAESRMIPLMNIGHYVAFEYYFHRLDDDEKLSRGMELVCYRGAPFAKLLIQNLNQMLQRRLFSSPNFVVIMKSFIVDPAYAQHAANTWHHAKNDVRGEEFVALMREIESIWIFNDHEHVEYVPSEILVQIWDEAPDSLKKFAFRFENNAYIRDLCLTYNALSDRTCKDEEFVSRVLHCVDARERRQFWWKEWSSMVPRSRPRDVREFLDICLDKNTDDVVRFIEEAASSNVIKDDYSRMATYCDFASLNDFLELFASSDASRVKEMKKTLLPNPNRVGNWLLNCQHDWDFMCEDEKRKLIEDQEINAMIEFINDAKDGDSRAIDEYKENVAKSCFDDFFFDEGIYIVTSRVTKALECLCDEEQIRRVKDEALENSRVFLTNNNEVDLEQYEWNEFFLWCLGDQYRVEEFKAFLEMDFG